MRADPEPGGLRAHRLRPVIEQASDFADAREAYACHIGENPFGKVVINVAGG